MNVLFLDLKIIPKIEKKIYTKHHVSANEAYEVIINQDYHIRKTGLLYLIYGQTFSGRYLFMVVKNIGNKIAQLITARDMNKKEKQFFQKLKRK